MVGFKEKILKDNLDALNSYEKKLIEFKWKTERWLWGEN